MSQKYALEWMGHSSSDILDIYYTMHNEVSQQAMATINYPSIVDSEIQSTSAA